MRNPALMAKTLDRLRLSAMTATWIEDGLEDVYQALWGEDSPIEPKENGSDYERNRVLGKKRRLLNGIKSMT